MNFSNDFSKLFTKSSFYIIKKEEDLGLDLKELYSKIIYHKKVDTFHINRKNEYLLGRVCASKAHELCIGTSLLSLPSGEDRAPIWPSGIIGSISHDKNWVGAVVANKSDLLGVGIDFEELGRTHLKLSSQIRNAKDIKSQPNFSEEELLTLIFSCKETFFKSLYPIVKKYFYFMDASLISIDPNTESFKIELLTELSPDFGPSARSIFHGRYKIINQTCFTVIEIPY